MPSCPGWWVWTPYICCRHKTCFLFNYFTFRVVLLQKTWQLVSLNTNKHFFITVSQFLLWDSAVQCARVSSTSKCRRAEPLTVITVGLSVWALSRPGHVSLEWLSQRQLLNPPLLAWAEELLNKKWNMFKNLKVSRPLKVLPVSGSWSETQKRVISFQMALLCRLSNIRG